MNSSPLGTANKLARSIWRALPVPYRVRRIVSPLYHRLVSSRLPRPIAVGNVKPGPLHIVGFLHSALGLGEAARLHLEAVREAGIPAIGIDISAMIDRRDFLGPDLGAADGRDGGLTVLHVNAPETLAVLAELGPRFYRRRMLVGYWHWELQRVPESWRPATRYLHEVWTSTSYCAAALRTLTDLPVRVVPLVPRPEPPGPGRSAFGLPDDVFLCLAAFDMRSSLARKNPLGAVRAFRMAFGDDPSALLVIKSHSVDPLHPAYRALMHEIGDACNIRIIDEVWPRQRMQHLIQCCDVAVSLHRAEGYGLLMAEAMSYGRVALGTGWSGNMDFMNSENSMPVDFTLVPVEDPQDIYALPNAMWAEPSVTDAAEKLLRLKLDLTLRLQLGANGRRTMERLGQAARLLVSYGLTAANVAGDKCALHRE